MSLPNVDQYRLIMAPKEFRWRGKRAPGLPILCERDGAVCEPVTFYIGWSHWRRRAALSSLQKEAYVLREWWAWMASAGKRWDEASDQIMSDWREAMRDRARLSDGKIGEQRIHDKCHVIFTFYDQLPDAMGLARVFVSLQGPIKEDSRPNFRMGWSRRPIKRWALNEGGGRNTVRRKVPDDELAQKVLTTLRNFSDDSDLNDRNWLLGRVMAEVGLRRDEAARLTVEMIERGLKEAGVQLPPGWKGLADVNDIDGRETLLKALDRLQHRQHRENVWIKVAGKGQVIREAPFPIGLIRDLLSFGIWGARKSQIHQWLASSSAFRPPVEVFLSERRRAMSAGAIGNLMKNAFAASGSDLSGHRLRAYFATKMASRLWHDAFAQNGFRWDQAVEDMVLDQVARALGHKQVTTTIRHYLELAQMEYFSAPTKSKLKELRKAVFALRELDKDELQLATKILQRLRELGPHSDFAAALVLLHAHPDLQPPPPAQQEKQTEQHRKRSELRMQIVPKPPKDDCGGVN